MEKEKLEKKKLRAQREGNTRLFADATSDLADLYFDEENLSAALQEHFQVVKACEILDDRLNSAVAHRKIGEIYTTLGEFKKALDHQNLHLEGAKGVKDKVEEQRALLTLGRTYFCLAESWPEKSKGKIFALAKARKAYSKSILLCTGFTTENIPKQELMTMRARLLLNLGQVLVAQEEVQLGIDLLEKAIKICSVNNLTDDLHRAHLTLGVFYERQKNLQLAIDHFDLAGRAETPSTKGNALLAKAELFLRSGDWSQARRVLTGSYRDDALSQSTRNQLEKWLRISVTLIRGERKLNSVDSKIGGFRLHEDLGDAAAAAGCYTKALEYYKGMLSIAEKNKWTKETATALFSLAQTSKDAGLYEEALKFGQRELKMCTDLCEAFKSALFLANVSESAGSPGKEICKAYKLALAKAVATGNPWLEITVLKEYLDYLKNNESKDAARIEKRLKRLQEETPEIMSQRESENANIGADIDLDNLSDLETETRPNPKRRRGMVVKRNLKGETPLHIACIRGKVEKVKELLEQGHPTNERDNCGWTPLHEAANHGFTEKVSLLIDAGAEINDPGGPKCGGVTPLHDAATNGHLAVMNLLINKGADIYAMTEEGETTLDSLEEWRSRAKKLSPADEKRYLHVRNKLWARKVRRREETRRIERAVTEKSEAMGLVNVPDGEGYKKILRLIRNRGAPPNSLK